MGNILKALKKCFSRRQHSADDNCGLDVVEDSPYYPFGFRQVDDDGDCGVVLYADDEYKKDIFESLGFEGNGYEWEAIAKLYIKQQLPEASSVVKFDPEADTFFAYSKDGAMLRKFVMGFKEFCEDDEKMRMTLASIDDENL